MNARLLVAALALAAPLAAQQPAKPDSTRHPMMGPEMSEMMGSPMMRELGPAVMKMMLYTPQHLLARKDAIGLSPDQVTRITALRDRGEAAREAAQRDAHAHLGELVEALNGAQPDTAVLKTHFQAAHGAMGRAHWAMLASAVQARAVLTDAQRTRMQAWADSMQMRQHHEMMMNPHGLP